MSDQIPCKNPQHPDGMSRYTMVPIRETSTDEAFACKACMDVNRVYSVQVRTKTAYRQHVRRELAREGKLAPRPQKAPMPGFYK